MQELIKITLKARKEDAVKRNHPWIFSGAIKQIEGNQIDGAIAEVYSDSGVYLGTGHYQQSSIMVRLFSFAPQKPGIPDEMFWFSKLSTALNLRTALGLTSNPRTNAYRLVHGEGDLMPGLIIDFYAGNAVIQAHSIGMHFERQKIKNALLMLYKNELESVYYKSSDTLPGQLASQTEDCCLFGQASKTTILENGLKFNVNWEEGQKTGFFLDQRDNRELVGKLSKGKTVLNTFCYTGGFSVYALKSGAKEVVSIDSSRKAITLTDENVKLNNSEGNQHKSICSDTMQYLKECPSSYYDLIILDPPAYAKHNSARHNAIQGYKRLNQLAMEKLKTEGLLFTFSCSQVVDMQLFSSSVVAAAIASGRQARILYRLNQPADHPISAFHPEGEYLKGLVLQII